jgi:hypothetical protein
MKLLTATLLILINFFLVSCTHTASYNKDKLWYVYTDSITGYRGYEDSNHKIMIPANKYALCYTDTFNNYAVVAVLNKGLLAIDKKEHVLYQVYNFDNGPDYAQDGLFRIVSNNKIGYANAITGKVIIKPMYEGAFPFINGKARVSYKCQNVNEGEHSYWKNGTWLYINTKGQIVQ